MQAITCSIQITKETIQQVLLQTLTLANQNKFRVFQGENALSRI